MIDPNTSSTVLTAMETYAQLVEPEYDIPPGGPPPMESPEWQNGVIPLDTLPAAWWNWMWKMVTEQEKRMVRYFNSIMTEFSNLLTAGGVASFDETVTNQLVTAIQTIARTPATTLICGAIKAGTAYGTLAVDGTTGVATVNGAGTGQFNTIATDITGAINELDGDIGQEINDRTSADNTLQGAIDGKAPINHASTANTYGQASSQNFGHVKLSDDYTDPTLDTTQGIAATPRAVALAVAAAGTTYSSVPIGTIASYAGPVTVAPRGWIPCDGRAISRTSYAALYAALGGANSPWGQGDGSTTFNVPDLRESTLVGTDQRTAGVIDHDVYTLGQFKDDQFQGHTHDILYRLLNGEPPSITLTSNGHGTYIGSSNDMKPGRGIYRTFTTSGGNIGWRNYSYSDVWTKEVHEQGWPGNDQIGTKNSDPVGDGTNGTPRTGTTTHGKQTGVNYIIKYEDVQADTSLMEYITNQNKLSASETITSTASSTNDIRYFEAEYDGFMSFCYECDMDSSLCRSGYSGFSNNEMLHVRISINGIYMADLRVIGAGYEAPVSGRSSGIIDSVTIPCKKGDIVQVEAGRIFIGNNNFATSWTPVPLFAVSSLWSQEVAQYYKDRDYGGA